ncbi:MAG TPA: hypothetical protein GX696_00495 [Pseudomonadaceae bacterium]|nr:hypothetical protein [Pseudomonadaceae bacterium]
MMVIPIKDEILLGVMQVINLRDDPAFTRKDLKHATMVAQMLARQFHSEFQSTQGPYDYLVQQGRISSRDLHEVVKNVNLYGGTVSKALMENFRIEADEIGKSLEFYYRVPYMKYDSKATLPLELMENIGLQYLRNNLWVPISGNREEVVILISDPSNYQRIMEIQGILNARNYVFRVGLPEHILQYLGSSEGDDDTPGFDDVFRNLEEESGIEVVDNREEEDEGAAATSAISGYRGRTGVHELLRGTHEMQNLIYNHSSLEQVRAQAIKDGMTTLRQDGIIKIFRGDTDYLQLLRVVSE